MKRYKEQFMNCPYSLEMVVSVKSKDVAKMTEQKALSNRRSHIRYDLQLESQYVIEDHTGHSLKCILTDICDTGVGLYVFQPLKEGQQILLSTTSRDSDKKGIVRWCHELGDNIYRAGIMFLGLR